MGHHFRTAVGQLARAIRDAPTLAEHKALQDQLYGFLRRQWHQTQEVRQTVRMWPYDQLDVPPQEDE